MNRKKFFKNLGNAISNILVVLSIALLAFSIFTAYQFKENPEDAYLFGYKPVFILTGSMEPTLKVNGVAIVEKTTYDEVEVGDIIMYEIGDKMITHRIIEKTEDGITTKGDNNNTQDAYLLTEENVKAKVVSIWNWVSVPMNDICPDGFGNGVNITGVIKWIGFPIFVIAVIKILFIVIRKINAMDEKDNEKQNDIEKTELTENKDENNN